MAPTTALPAAVTAYFTLIDSADKSGIVDLFTADAVVTDDGRSYRGRDQITAWLDTAASEYTVTTTRLSTEVVGGVVTVTTRLEGNFPGGIVDLRNIFEVDTQGLLTSVLITV